MANPTKVQVTKVTPGTTATVTLVLSGSPVAGNLLLAAIGYSQFQAVRSITPPSGAWTKVATKTQVNDSVDVYSYKVQNGDGTSWAFTINTNGTNDRGVGILYEISGQSPSTPVDQSNTSGGTSVSSQASGNITPSVLNTLPIAFLTTDGASSASQSVSGVTGTFTLDQSANANDFHSLFSALGTLTVDTSTAIGTTWSLAVADTVAGIIVNIQPPTSNLTGVISGSASVADNLTGVGALTLSDAASATVAANLAGSGSLIAGIATSSPVVATLVGIGSLGSSILGSSTFLGGSPVTMGCQMPGSSSLTCSATAGNPQGGSPPGTQFNYGYGLGIG